MNLISPQREQPGAPDPTAAAREWLDTFDRIAMATVVSTFGSAPVPVGGQLAIAPGERMVGSVSGGCVETEVIAEAADVIALGRPKLLEFGVDDETAWRVGLPCGGRIKVFIEPLEGTAAAAHLDAVMAAQRARQPLAVLTDLATGARQIITPGSDLARSLAEMIAGGESRLFEWNGAPAFLHFHAPAIRIVVAGATHIAQVLTELARQLNYEVIVVDPRSAFATEARFGGARLMAEWPEASFEAIGLDHRTAVVALTHMAQIDDEALGEALRSNAFYIGALGSKRSHGKRIERLQAAGFNDDSLARIHAPVGLDIGAKGPAEIALSIIAEIVKTARGPASP